MLSIVIPTLGTRPEQLERLLDSLARQTSPARQVVVVDQSTGDAIELLVERWSNRLPVERLSSERGASRARNVGARGSRQDILGFLDDDCLCPPTTLANALRIFDDVSVTAATSVVVSDDETTRLRFNGRARDLDDKSVWTNAIEAGTFCRRRNFAVLDGFDEDLGIGCDTPWQSGEGTDLLLRGLAVGWRIRFDPSIRIQEQATEMATGGYLLKVRKYARGTGRVVALRSARGQSITVALKPFLGFLMYLMRGNTREAHRLLQVCLGRLEGLFGRTTDLLVPVSEVKWPTRFVSGEPTREAAGA